MGLNPLQIREAVERAVSAVEIPSSMLEKSPFELSGGQKRRVAIAGVIAMNPRVLILDEPTAGLDPKGRDTILALIQKYHRQEHNTVLLVSHSMEDVAKYATKVLVMNRSQLYAYEDVDSIFTRAAEIEKIGLSVPQITKVFHQLAELGYPVNSNTYRVQEASEQLLRLLKKKGEQEC